MQHVSSMRRAGFAAAVACILAASPSLAADHGEAPLVQNDPAADLADVYAWHDASNSKLIAIITFDGRKSPAQGQQGTYDPGVIYTVHIDNTGDFISDIAIDTQFAMDTQGRWGLMVSNLPGAGAPVIGPVEKKIMVNPKCRVFAGLRDDPFFFDVQGFVETLQTGTLSFVGNRDGFAATNATAIALEMDLGAALGGASTLNLWATTARVE